MCITPAATDTPIMYYLYGLAIAMNGIFTTRARSDEITLKFQCFQIQVQNATKDSEL